MEHPRCHASSRTSRRPSAPGGRPSRTAATAAMRMALALAREDGAFVTVSFLSPQPAWIPVSLLLRRPGPHDRGRTQAARRPGGVVPGRRREVGPRRKRPFEHGITVPSLPSLMGGTRLDTVAGRRRDGREKAPLSSNIRRSSRACCYGAGARSSLCPKAGDRGPPRTVSIAWDGSIQADACRRRRAADPTEGGKGPRGHRHGREGHRKRDAERTPGCLLSAPRRAGARRGSHRANGRVADTLRAHFVANDSDMLVMGAYAHSRLHEAVLGGVTRTLLAAAPIPLFMSH